MADITMCCGDACKKKSKCYRYTANAHPYRQSFFAVVPLNVAEEDGKEVQTCDYFWDNRGDR
jgi:benzoyl-CoA reductase/2-hydroxyglutaryl-CoA dehydratase subunit BcrC/BadD/HgdB